MKFEIPSDKLKQVIVKWIDSKYDRFVEDPEENDKDQSVYFWTYGAGTLVFIHHKRTNNVTLYDPQLFNHIIPLLGVNKKECIPYIKIWITGRFGIEVNKVYLSEYVSRYIM